MSQWVLLVLLAELWLSLQVGQCRSSKAENPIKVGYKSPFCCNTSSTKTCFTTRKPVSSNPLSSVAVPSANLGYVHETGSSQTQCDCVDPQGNRISAVCEADFDGKWKSCNCKEKDCIVCREEKEISDVVTKEIASSQPKNPFSDVVYNLTTTPIAVTATTDPIVPASTIYDSTIDADGNTDSTSSNTEKTPKKERQTGQLGSLSAYTILLILILIVVVVFIIVAVVLFMRKRKLDKRSEWSPVTYTSQGDTVTNVYADGTAPAGNHIYDELDMLTLDPTPSNVYDNTQPTSVAVDMGKCADYVDIDLPMKDQQKPMSTGKSALSLSPVYSEPFESSMSASNTEYAEPFKPGTTITTTAPVLNHNSAAGDQQNDVYSLAKAIPLSDANVIYSQPNKPTKSSEPTGEVGGATDPIHSETIGVVPGAGGAVTQDPNVVYAEPMRSNTGAGGVITQDPNAVYAEQMKLKKSS